MHELTAEQLVEATQGYFIFDSRSGKWLQEDERSWGKFDEEPAQFTQFDYARDIARRQRADMDGILVLAWIDPEGSLS